GNLDVTGNGSITVGTGNFTGNDVVVNLGENNKFADTLLSKLDTTNVYMIKENESLSDGKLELTYNTKLYDDPTLNNINNKAHIVNDKFSENPEERKVQLDKIYTENIYTETVRAAYDTLKSTEKTILSFEPELKTGEFKAEGKGLYSKNKYTKDGITNSYDVEVETSGLLASLEYGVTDTMTTGIVFAGSKQDVDIDGGSADADIFYLGAYGTKAYGNYDFTAGLGYQFGKYEADNNIGNVATSDKYDSKALSGYVQGKYVAKFEEGLSIQPKVKLGYTYLKQDDTKDNYFGVSDAKVKTFDTEVGVDVVKTVQLEKSKLDVTFGTSYVRTMGDTDKMFKGHFYGNNTSNSFGVLGAELAKNVVKFNLGAEVASENGFFYNGGLTYEFGGNDTKAYGVNLGVGYKF
ncbi:autotransporter outer membrane beta-barrel domain-containing protein, partial [Fusobacterium sp.]|uniref:autotransporter outer membrane beta-barrel domain-containing protein n=1 Tax=Fusobacterium sp. TaxID=68766 RepID=UPI00262FD72D